MRLDSFRFRATTSSRCATARRARSQAFTLVELLAVVAILAALALIALPDSRPAAEARLDHSAAAVAEALRFSRSEAIRTGDAYGTRIDDGTRRVRVFRVDTSTTPPTAVFDVYDPLTRQLYNVDLGERSRGLGIEVTSSFLHSALCDVGGSIVFSGGATPRCESPWKSMLSNATFVLDIDGAQRTVHVDGETGRTWVE